MRDTLVVCDDFSLDFGQLRVRRQGSDGGHNGLGSIIYQLESDLFARLRLGIGAAPQSVDTADFVLERFSKKEKQQLGIFVKESADCCVSWLTEDIELVMSQFNKRKENGKV